MDTERPHLTAEEVAAYVSGAVEGEAHERMQAHLADCARCSHEVADVVRSVREAGSRPARRRWLLAAGLGAAAVLAGVLLVGPRLATSNQDEGRVFRGEQGRPVEVHVPAIDAIEPANGTTVSRDSVRFVWATLDADALYSLTLTNSQGDVLWKGSTRDTTLSVANEVVFRPGQRYFWYVDALYRGSESTSTGAQRFAVR